MKRWISYFLTFCLLFTLYSCTTEKVVIKDIPEGYILIKKETLNSLLNETIDLKSQLLECLERERACK
jgi:hypothetical protein